MGETEIRAFNERQLAERLNLSVKTLQSWRLKGTGPKYRKLGTHAVRYLESDVADWLRESRR